MSLSSFVFTPDMSGRRFPAAVGGVEAGDPAALHLAEAPHSNRLEIGAGDAEEYLTAEDCSSDEEEAYWTADEELPV